MTTYTFATLADPSLFDEVQDTGYVDPLGQSRTLWVRPPAGQTIKCRNADTLTALPDTTTLLGGYVSFTTTDVPKVQISTDGGSTWVGPLVAIEALVAAVNAGVDATSALALANQALTAANAALAAVGSASTAVLSVAGRGGAVVLTKSDVGLGSVDNTSDLAKPLSTAVTAALGGKQKSIPRYADATAAATGLANGEFADGDLILVLS